MEKELGIKIQLPKYIDPRGNLTVAEGQDCIPFEIARAYWVTDVPGGEFRGGHAHRECVEFIVAASGSFDVTLDDGTRKQTYHLNHPWEGLLVGTGIWRTLEDFCMVLASQKFREEDYIREYDEYKAIYGRG